MPETGQLHDVRPAAKINLLYSIIYLLERK